MVAQVLMEERVMVGSAVRVRTGLAFGDHPDIESDPSSQEFDDRMVTAAVARGTQQIRVVVDELLLGNAIEELRCADGTTFSRIPVGTTPEDIANCAGPDFSKCTGDHVVCIGTGGPIGILDEDPQDGAADDFRMIDYGSGRLAVEVVCDDVSIPLEQEQSFYNPSGNQQIPAGDIGLNGLGPALVLVPVDGMRTSADCTLVFNGEVTDKEGLEICAPPGGDFREGNCSPGDTSEIAWQVEPLTLQGSDPSNGRTNVPLTAPSQTFATMLLDFNAGIDQDAAIAGITLETGGAGVTIDVTVSVEDPEIVTITVPGGFTAASEYTLTVSTAVTDIFGGPLPEDVVITFMTVP